MSLENFDAIYHRACERKGGTAALESLLHTPASPEQLASMPDDRYLSLMTKVIFQSGFVWRVIEDKWPGFEQAFFNFAPEKMVLLNDAHFERLMQDTRIVRNAQKIKTVPHNAQMISEVARHHGGFGRFIADWPGEDTVGLWLWLKKHGARLGGNSASYLLRRAGKDTFVFSRDVVAYFKACKVIEKDPTSQRDMRTLEHIFNDWHAESARPLCQLSQIVAYATGENVVQAAQ